MNEPTVTLESLSVVPAEVWRRFRDGGGLERFEPLEFVSPIKNHRLEPEGAQRRVDRQRHRFRRLIAELFPTADVERFIESRLAAGNLPMISPFDMNQKFAHVLRAMVKAQRPGNSVAPFDLSADRANSRYDEGLFNREEDLFAVRMLEYRPAVALSILFLRKYLVEYGVLLNRVAAGSLPPEWKEPFRFFAESWNQNTLVRVLYPAVCIHLQPVIDASTNSVACPELTQDLIRDALNWLMTNDGFKGRAQRAQHGHDSNMSCAATGFLNNGIGRRGWLKSVFDEVVRQRDDAVMQADLQRIDAHREALFRLIT